MQKILIAIFLVTVTITVDAQKPQKPLPLKQGTPFAQTITAADLRKHLSIVASAEMEGRETATEGERKAAEYIEGVMRSVGLQPGFKGQYQMPWPVYRDSVTSASLVINDQPVAYNKDFTVSASNYTATQAFSNLVYVNFNDSLWRNNKVEVSGKLVLFRFNAPETGSGRGAFGNSPMLRVMQLMAKGAIAALMVSDNLRATNPLGGMTVTRYPSRQMINTFTISNAAASQLLGAAKAAEEQAGKLMSGPIDANVVMNYTETTQQLQSRNVLGLLPGTDKADEYVVITAHHDHIGRQGDKINYGADDDGSGTVSVLELAEAFAKAKAAGKGPRRSILFMTVGGEEKGLWGSAYYGDHPAYPLDKTSANLNIDMIGRIDSLYDKTDTSQYVYVVGDDKLSSDLPGIVKTANAFTKLHLDPKYNDPKDPMRIYFRSDHYNFARKGVPVLFFFDGLHKDYHQPTDTFDKIEYELMAKRAQLVFYTAWEMANRNYMLKRDIPLPAAALGR